MISKINLVINEEGVKTVGEPNNFPIDYIGIVENFVEKSNYVANYHDKKKISVTNNSR